MSDDKLIARIKLVCAHIADTLDIPLLVGLWDGSVISLGKDEPTRKFSLNIHDKRVIASLLRRPVPENLVRHYARGHITLDGGDLIDIGQAVRGRLQKKNIKRLRKFWMLRQLIPFLFVPGTRADMQHKFTSNETGADLKKRNNKDYIQFHYDVSNDFYKLFLDPEMQYSCGYFTDWNNSLEQAQQDKLDMICKKLRLQEGDRFLDIGCGWGGLICHAARHYGVKAHGVTLSQKQYDFAREKIRKMGLEQRVTIEIKDYAALEGEYDKIASIGMFEHIGLDNFPHYFRKVNSLLRPRGIFLNHGIARRAKVSKKRERHITAEKKLILKYIFPGSELAPIGFTLNSMESHGFEIHDVEALREHYAITCRHWCKRLYTNKEQAVKQVGEERYNLWVAYLAGVSFGFTAGSILIFQSVTTKRGKGKGVSGMPPTRADLYL